MHKYKKFILLIAMIIIFAILFKNFSGETTSAPMFIVEKGIDKKTKKLYFKGRMFESDSKSHIRPVTILVDDKNIWNLIVLNKAYLVDYSISTNYNKLNIIFYDENFENTYRHLFYTD